MSRFTSRNHERDWRRWRVEESRWLWLESARVDLERAEPEVAEEEVSTTSLRARSWSGLRRSLYLRRALERVYGATKPNRSFQLRISQVLERATHNGLWSRRTTSVSWSGLLLRHHRPARIFQQTSSSELSSGAVTGSGVKWSAGRCASHDPWSECSELDEEAAPTLWLVEFYLFYGLFEIC